MSEDPVNWHYGLMAERWAESIHETYELPYFKHSIDRFGTPVLDLACGAGRLLLPLLSDGIDIDGCDISGDMLAHCRSKASRAGLNPNLYQQSMHTIDLPRRYKTIYICNSFGLGGSRENDLETLRRCYANLETGGALVFNLQAEYNSPESWNLWLRENRSAFPQSWPEEGNRREAADGSEYIAYFRYIEFDPLEQRFVRQVQIEKWFRGKLVAKEQYNLHGNIYFKQEMLALLKIAGFQTISVTGDFSDEPATADHEELVFTATK